MRVRKHVLSDLQPYICTYPDCQLNDYFFENKDDWFHHESHTHRVEWFCNTASHKSFVDIPEFLDHMHTIHSEPLDKVQLLNIHHGFQRPSNAHSGICTLCGKHASRLKSHLARHLEQIALFAIPQTDYMDVLKENDTSSNAARQSTSASTDNLSMDEPWSEPWSEPDDLLSFDFDEREHKDRQRARFQDLGVYGEIVPDLADHLEGNIDISWDYVTSKLRDSMNTTQDEQLIRSLKIRPSPVRRNANAMIPTLSGFREASTLPSSSRGDNKVIPEASLERSVVRPRASRIASTILSPFRSLPKYFAGGSDSDLTRPAQNFEEIPEEERSWNTDLERNVTLRRRRIQPREYEPSIAYSIHGQNSDKDDNYVSSPPLTPEIHDAHIDPQPSSTWQERIHKAVGGESKSSRPMSTEQDVSPHIESAMARPARCSHRFKLMKLDDTALTLHGKCQMCLILHSSIYECDRCKLQTCQSCAAIKNRIVEGYV